MGQPNITEIEASLKDWDFLEKLPKELCGFQLEPGSGIMGQILNIAAYAKPAERTRLDLTYTTETFDYVPVKTVGMHVFRDERYFYRDREQFASVMLDQLPRIIQDIDRVHPHGLNCEATGLQLEQWEFWRSLPKQLGNYELFITPDNPLAYLNGSYILLDYSDFERGNQIYFAYNIFRNELFAEKKKGYFPLTTNVFDVPKSVKDERKLDMLAELIQTHLEKTMLELEKS